MYKSASPFHDLANRLIAEQIEKRGFEDSVLFAYWQDILPTSLAKWTTPKRLKRTRQGQNELIIGVVPVKITEMRYFCDLIREEINQFFAFTMVDKVSVVPDASLFQNCFEPTTQDKGI